MTKIYCFSGGGHTLAVAQAFSEMLGCEIADITHSTEHFPDTAIIIFPVYCQNIPGPVKAFLKSFHAKHIVLIATYGRISHGNVLWEAQNLVQGDVIAGAYIPTGHSFLNESCNFSAECLLPIADRIRTPCKVQLPKCRKNLLANIMPAFRSRISVKIRKNELCSNCGICQERCPMHAIKDGKITSQCIRCLRCVVNCPQGALRYENSWILNQYLNRYSKHCEPTVYL